MGLIGQVSLARAGTALELEFEVEDLKDVIENQAKPGGHVTLHPGDFSELDVEIQIPEGVGVTILPGAKVEYTDDFRRKNCDPCPDDCFVYDHDGSPVDSNDDHPLNFDFKRYDKPNFTGHVENIADMNLASEWAFEISPQTWTARRSGTDDEIRVFGGDPNRDLRTLNFSGGPGAEVAMKEGQREVQIALDPESFVRSLNLNRLLFEENNNSVGDLSISHEAVNTTINPDPGTDEDDPTGGARIIRGLSIHESEPGDTEGPPEPDGHVEFVEEANLLAGTGVTINVSENAGAPDDIEISGLSEGEVDTGVTSITAGTDLTQNQTDGDVTIDHADTGGSFTFDVGNVVETNSRGHVQEAVTVGTSSSLTVDANAGTLKHDVNAANGNTDSAFITEVDVDPNGHVTNIATGNAATENTFIDGGSHDTPSNTLTLDRSDDATINIVIEPGGLFHDNEAEAVSMPDGDTIRFSSDEGTLTGTILDINDNSSETFFSKNSEFSNENIDNEIRGNSSLALLTDNSDKLVMSATSDLGNANPTIVMNPEVAGDMKVGADNEVRFGFEKNRIENFGENVTTGIHIEAGTSSTSFPTTNPRIVLANEGFIDIPLRGNSEPDPANPPDGYVRMFGRSFGGGTDAEIVFLEASGGTRVLTPSN